MNNDDKHENGTRRELSADEHEQTALDALQWAANAFGGRVALASSLGAEDQVITDLIMRHKLQIKLFTLDTGKLFPQTQELIGRTEKRYGMHIEVYRPDPLAVQEMIGRHGDELYRESVELRRSCCEIRKLAPLRRALSGLDAWICGLRNGQGETRHSIRVIEWDGGHEIVKINPLADWSEEDVWGYVTAHEVPVNALHSQGFPSIGCSCCTRAVAPGEDIRAGRWWWERPEHKECGLHLHHAGASQEFKSRHSAPRHLQTVA